MARKQELQAELVELQKKFAAASAELKQIQDAERSARKMQKFSAYPLKVALTDDGVASKVEALSSGEYDDCDIGQDGIPYMKYKTSNTRDYILLKSESELPRMQLLFKRIRAVMGLGADKADNQQLIKVILGED